MTHADATEIRKTIDQCWDRIEAWAAKEFPKLRATFGDGASDEALDAFEERFQCTLPVAFRASWQRHDGQTGHPAFLRHRDIYRLLPLDLIVEDLEYWIRTSRRGKTVAAVPIGRAGNGDLLWLDVGREDGPIRLRSHDSPGVPKVADSYLDWITTMADDLDAGRYTINQYGSLGRRIPDDAEIDALIEDLAVQVAAEDGRMRTLMDRLVAAFDQPQWVVEDYVSLWHAEQQLKKAVAARSR